MQVTLDKNGIDLNNAPEQIAPVEPLISVRNLQKQFGNLSALRGVDQDI